MVLKILNSVLTHNLTHNPHLIYALLYQQGLFEPFKAHKRYGNLVSNIEKVIVFFNIALTKVATPEWSAEQVLEVIKINAISWKGDAMTVLLPSYPANTPLQPFVQLQFKYEEEENSQEFFTPYVWCIAFHYAAIPWDQDKIRLFSLTPASAADNAEYEDILVEEV